MVEIRTLEEEIEELTEDDLIVLKMFAIEYAKTGKVASISEAKLKGIAWRKNLPIEDILKKLVRMNILETKEKGTKRIYYLTMHGWEVAQRLWGPGISRLRPVGGVT